MEYYWKIMSHKPSALGWSWDCVSTVASNRQIFVTDAHRDNRKRSVVRSDEKLTAFLELERATRDDSH